MGPKKNGRRPQSATSANVAFLPLWFSLFAGLLGAQSLDYHSYKTTVEPIFLKYGVDVVLSGHDHVYERIKPQKGIYYFVSGAGGKLRTGDVEKDSGITEKSYDRDLHFMLFEVDGNQMYFQAISRTGETIDSGVINRK